MLSKLPATRLCVALCLSFIFSTAIAQQRTVNGNVKGDDNNPVVGATVAVKSTTISTQTDVNGNFTITIPNGRNILTITSIGFESIDVSVSGQGTVTITLKASTSSLNEVIVTGYGAQRKKDITGSVSVVNVNNLKQVPGGTTESLLQGQASGVTVINSGVPGGGSNVRIRGLTSIGNVDPLVIIDGTPGSLHDLNVNDIESLQVLKDAGAAAIYGVRGSNGVIVVTTKKGRPGKTRINYDMYYGWQQSLKNGFHIASTAETGNAIYREFFDDSLAFNNKQFGTGTGPTIPDYITPTRAFAGDPNTDPSKYALYSNQITMANKVGTDWFHEIFKPAPEQSHTLSASGGGEKSSYYFSLGYFNQQGTLLGTYLKRYSARINTLFNIKDNVRFGENAYIFFKQNPGFTNQNEGNIISYSYRESPIIPVYDIKGNFAGTGSQGLGNSQNPVANALRSANNRSNDWQASGNVFAEVDFLKHFTARTSVGGNFDNYYYYFFNYTGYENAENNTNPNSFGEGAGYNSQLTWTNQLTYSNTFGKHTVKVIGGTEAIDYYGRFQQSTRSGYFITNSSNLTVDPNLWTLNFGPASSQTNQGAPYQSSLYSLFGRLDYSFGDRYLIAGTIRRDGSSVFAPGKRFGIFPSVSGAWRISREAFFPTLSWLNELKIRGGWGKLGSLSNINPTNPYNLYSLSAAAANYDINGTNTGSALGAYASQNGNANTTWEQDVVSNVGLDATLFKNKLDFTIDWYNKAVSGLLFRPNVAAVYGGASAAFVNSGDIKNTGWDAALTYHGTINRDWRFDVTGTFTSYNNRVKSLPNGTKYVDEGSAGSGRIGAFTRLQPGQPIGEFFGFQSLGLFQSWDDVNKSPKQQDAAPGRLKFQDVNGDGVIDANDRTFFGNPNPTFTSGLVISVSYKNFDFNTFLYASVGNKALNYVRYWTDFPQVFEGAVSKDAVYNSAQLVNAAGQPVSFKDPTAHVANPGAFVPLLERSANFSNTINVSSYFMENASFLRMKTITLGFTIPQRQLNRFKVDKFRVFGQISNLFTITKYKGLDPELTTSDLNNNTNFGIDFGNYPSNQKMYTLGVNVSF